MRLLNEIERVTLRVPDGRQVDALVRVRGFDARSGGRGAVQRQQEPVAIDAGLDGGIIDIPKASFGFPAWAFVAIPILSYLVRFSIRKGTR